MKGKGSSGESEARRRLLAAAVRLFARDGFAGARVDAIAAAAGVNKALLYYHVGDKAALYEAALLQGLEALLAAVRAEVGSQSGPEEKLAALAATFEEFARDRHEYPQILVREFSSGGSNLSPAVLGKVGAFFEIEGAILEEGRRAGIFRPLGPVTLHLVLVLGTIMHVMGRPLIERASRLGGRGAVQIPSSPSREVLGLILGGLRTGGQGRRGRSGARGERRRGAAPRRTTNAKGRGKEEAR